MATIEYGFDVFLSHNSHDKPAVRELAQALTQRGLRVWLDEQELPPGQPFQPLLEKGIRESASAVVLIGKDGLGPWEDEEMQAVLDLAVKDKRPVIPVLLPDAPAAPKLPLFLSNRTWVDLRPAITEDKLDRLEWGITGIKPSSRPGSGTPTGTLANPATPPTTTSTKSLHPAALKTWLERLDFLLEQEAITSDAAQKFSLKKQIEEARQKIRELEG